LSELIFFFWRGSFAAAPKEKNSECGEQEKAPKKEIKSLNDKFFPSPYFPEMIIFAPKF